MAEAHSIRSVLPVGKVILASVEHNLVRVALTNGNLIDVWIAEADAYAVGDVVIVDPDEQQIEKVSHDLWPLATSVGVVRLVRDTEVVISDAHGNLRKLAPPTQGRCQVSNTVEYTEDRVLRVLAEHSVAPFDRDTDRVDVTRFGPLAPEGTGLAGFGGMKDVVARAKELIEVSLRRREDLDAIGASPIAGLLFSGPPGTGKTLLARAIAREAQVDFYLVSGPSIFSKWYGESEAVLRAIFEDAARRDAAIIFFDELDSVAAQRDERSHEESQRVVAQLLTEMDGFTERGNVVVIAATNRPDAIDPALRRPGRFDWEVVFRLPDETGRLEILRRQSESLRAGAELPLAHIAATTPGWSGADLGLIWREAALIAVVDGRRRLYPDDVMRGLERATAQRARRRQSEGAE